MELRQGALYLEYYVESLGVFSLERVCREEMSEEGSSSGSDGWETDDSCERDAAGAASSAAGSSRRDSGPSGANRGAMSGPARGTLRLDKTQASAGEVVGVYWDIPTVQTSAGDWIAIYERGGTH